MKIIYINLKNKNQRGIYDEYLNHVPKEYKEIFGYNWDAFKDLFANFPVESIIFLHNGYPDLSVDELNIYNSIIDYINTEYDNLSFYYDNGLCRCD